MQDQQNKTISKTLIILLAILLGLSLVALAITMIYPNFADSHPTSVVVPNNLIKPEGEPATSIDTALFSSDPSSKDKREIENKQENIESHSKKTAVLISLCENQSFENKSFHGVNLFPGDQETKNFCVQVSYQNQIVVRHRTHIRPGYEKLAEVLKSKVVLLSTGDTLYDGLMRDMPESLGHTLSSEMAATDNLYYAITAYLDSSVNNEYMDQTLIADFHWWVEEIENLQPSPRTGANAFILLWITICVASGTMLILLIRRHRKEAQRGR